MNKILLSFTALALFLFTPAISQPDRNPERKPRQGGMIQKLNLNDTQKKEFERLNSDLAKAEVAEEAKVKTAQIDLHQLMRSDTPDKAAIEKKIGEISELEARRKILKVDHWFAVNKMLNADQQKIWKDMLNHPPAARLAMRLRQLRDRFFGGEHARPGPDGEGPRY